MPRCDELITLIQSIEKHQNHFEIASKNIQQSITRIREAEEDSSYDKVLSLHYYNDIFRRLEGLCEHIWPLPSSIANDIEHLIVSNINNNHRILLHFNLCVSALLFTALITISNRWASSLGSASSSEPLYSKGNKSDNEIFSELLLKRQEKLPRNKAIIFLEDLTKALLNTGDPLLRCTKTNLSYLQLAINSMTAQSVKQEKVEVENSNNDKEKQSTNSNDISKFALFFCANGTLYTQHEIDNKSCEKCDTQHPFKDLTKHFMLTSTFEALAEVSQKLKERVASSCNP